MADPGKVEKLVNSLSEDSEMRADLKSFLKKAVELFQSSDNSSYLSLIDQIFTEEKIKKYSSGLYPSYDALDSHKFILEEMEGGLEKKNIKPKRKYSADSLYDQLLTAIEYVSHVKHDLAIRRPNQCDKLFPSSSFEYKGNNDTRLLDDDSSYYSYISKY